MTSAQDVAPLAGLHAWRDDVRVNRIRYPRPNRLGLARARGQLTPYAETIGGRVVEV